LQHLAIDDLLCQPVKDEQMTHALKAVATRRYKIRRTIFSAQSVREIRVSVYRATAWRQFRNLHRAPVLTLPYNLSNSWTINNRYNSHCLDLFRMHAAAGEADD
jgi:hypothetical protein